MCLTLKITHTTEDTKTIPKVTDEVAQEIEQEIQVTVQVSTPVSQEVKEKQALTHRASVQSPWPFSSLESSVWNQSALYLHIGSFHTPILLQCSWYPFNHTDLFQLWECCLFYTVTETLYACSYLESPSLTRQRCTKRVTKGHVSLSRLCLTVLYPHE